MSAGTLLAALATLLPAVNGDEVAHVDVSLEPGTEILGASFVDVDSDGRDEVVLALLGKDGTRELRLHRILADRVEGAPFATLPVLDAAIAYGFADVRPEPGRELFFLARGGAWSYSLTRDGYRDNLERLAELDLLYDVADPHDLPAWEYVVPRPGGDWILLPGAGGCVVWGPDGARTAEASHHALAVLPRHDAPSGLAPRDDGERRREEREERRARAERRATAPLPDPFLAAEDASARDFLASERGYGAPALADLDGDGRPELLVLGATELTVHGGDAGSLGRPARVEPLPDYLLVEDRQRLLDLVDLDGDGDMDVLARLEEEEDGLENTEVRLLLLLNDGRRLFPAQPDQVLRIEAAGLEVEVADVDGDGRPDLAVRKFELPSLLGAVTGMEFLHTYLVFRGTAGEHPFERKPLLKQTETYDETNFEEAIKNRVWRMDCDGDGRADLVEVDLKGRIAIRRVEHSSSFFGGDSWGLESTPWRRFETAGDIERLEVRDLNGDGLGDVISRGDEALTILLSTRKGGPR